MSSFRKTIQCFRPIGAWSGAHWNQTSEDPFTIQASVQPAKDADMKMLPEGRRTDGLFRLYSDTALQLALEGTDQNADQVVIFDERYEAVAIARWDNGVIPHFKIVVQRMQPA